MIILIKLTTLILYNPDMRFIYFYIFLCCSAFLQAQNNVRLLSGNGAAFKVYNNDRALNKSAQASVLIEKINKDTLYLKVEFENSTKYGITVYLLDKGLHTSQKEFNFMLKPGKNKIDVDFTGVYDIDELPEPIVPGRTRADTSIDLKNALLAHFCEIKNDACLYFNNLPKDGNCTIAMPGEYMTYATLLITKVKTAGEKYEVVENVCRNNCLNMAQLNMLLKYIDFEPDKLKLIKLAYYNLTDQAAQSGLEKNFKMEAWLNELRTFFKNSEDYKVKSANSCIKASPEQEIRNISDRLLSATNDTQRYEALKKTYADHCYSVNQVILLLQKFSHDREKLQAARLLYYNCAEKSAYINTSVAFSYDQSVAELKDFISKQGR